MRWIIRLLLVLWANTVAAEDGARCGRSLVSDGQGRRDIWIYDRGPEEFARIFIFDNGVLIDIEVGGYGKSP